jgi:hypothetical protein
MTATCRLAAILADVQGKGLGNRRLRDASSVRQRAHSLFAVAAQPFEDRAAGRVGESAEKLVRRDGYHS